MELKKKKTKRWARSSPSPSGTQTVGCNTKIGLGRSIRMHRAHCFLKDSHRRSKGGHQRLPWWPWQAEWGPHTLLPGGFDGVYAKGRTKTPGFGGIWMGWGGKGRDPCCGRRYSGKPKRNIHKKDLSKTLWPQPQG